MTTPEPEPQDVADAPVDTDATEDAAAAGATAEAGAIEDTGAIAEAGAIEDTGAAEDVAPVETATPVVLSGRPVQTVGRRKEAVVRVRFMPGTGAFRLNGRTLEEYFPNKLHQQLIREPLVTVEKTERFDIFANLHGGGTSGQAGALRLAIARALIEVDPDDRPPLKKAGFLTRDPRVIERKKYGLKKARKAPQYSKR